MPRAARVKCAGCDKTIDAGLSRSCCNGLFHLFLFARSIKKVSISDSAYRKCRWKFDNWKKKLNGELNDILDVDNTNDIVVNINSGLVRYELFPISLGA